MVAHSVKGEADLTGIQAYQTDGKTGRWEGGLLILPEKQT